MKRSHSQQITIGLGLALALLVANTVVSSYRNTLKLISNQRLVTHTQKVLTELKAISTLKDAETGQRGYLITGEERYLQNK